MIDFKEILQKQKELDIAINGGYRNIHKIRRSMVAEVIEFDETTDFSHKTWKITQGKRQKKLEEFTDILFFIAQYFNKMERDDYMFIAGKLDSEENEVADIDVFINRFIADCATKTIRIVVDKFFTLAKYMDFSDSEIYCEYLRKWEINMGRIGKEWK